MDWELIDNFVQDSNLVKTEISSWFVGEVRDAFENEGWNPYKKQNLKTSVTYLKTSESDQSKKDRVLKLKTQLCERIQKVSNNKIALNEVTFNLNCVNPLKWVSPYLRWTGQTISQKIRSSLFQYATLMPKIIEKLNQLKRDPLFADTKWSALIPSL